MPCCKFDLIVVSFLFLLTSSIVMCKLSLEGCLVAIVFLFIYIVVFLLFFFDVIFAEPIVITACEFLVQNATSASSVVTPIGPYILAFASRVHQGKNDKEGVTELLLANSWKKGRRAEESRKLDSGMMAAITGSLLQLVLHSRQQSSTVFGKR